MSTIVIDPGHGGSVSNGGSNANNARGRNGMLEKDITLRIGVKTAELLNNAGHSVIMTRNNDSNLGLAERARVAANNDADVFVSIHFNGDSSSSVQGTETWVHLTSTNDSRLLASSLLQRLVQVTGYVNRGLRSNNFGVLSPAIHDISTATCLIEISFITDPSDEARLNTLSYQNQLAQGIAQGIIDFINRATIQIMIPSQSSILSNDGDV